MKKTSAPASKTGKAPAAPDSSWLKPLYHYFIEGMDNAERERFAARVGTSAGHLKRVAYGHAPIGAALSIRIDVETEGALTVEQLRPDLPWAYLRRNGRQLAQRLIEKRAPDKRRAA